MKALALALTLAAALPAPALADARGKEIEAFMAEYIRLWNAGDAQTITDKVYRFEGPNAMGTKAGLEAQFQQLKAQGYDHSTTASIEGCLLSATQGLAELRYSRIKTDGTPMPPKDRITLYMLRKFPDGWRITQLIGMGAGSDLTCKSLAE
jgi:hypothetical protein